LIVAVDSQVLYHKSVTFEPKTLTQGELLEMYRRLSETKFASFSRFIPYPPVVDPRLPDAHPSRQPREPIPLDDLGQRVVKVRREHIERGRRGEATGCAIAMALREMQFAKFGREWGQFTVSTSLIEFSYTDGYGRTRRMQWDVPAKAREFISRFDNESLPKDRMEPFEFTLGQPRRGF
jgi:hypothetical protein